ncbi:MAG: dodecin family protein [Nitrospirota bacterium]
MAVARITTITASSPAGWQEAVQEGLDRANKTLRNITGVKILDQKAKIEDGKIAEYRVTMEIIFVLED